MSIIKNVYTAPLRWERSILKALIRWDDFFSRLIVFLCRIQIKTIIFDKMSSLFTKLHVIKEFLNPNSYGISDSVAKMGWGAGYKDIPLIYHGSSNFGLYIAIDHLLP